MASHAWVPSDFHPSTPTPTLVITLAYLKPRVLESHDTVRQGVPRNQDGMQDKLPEEGHLQSCGGEMLLLLEPLLAACQR